MTFLLPLDIKWLKDYRPVSIFFLTPMHKNEKIKSFYLEESNKILYDFLFEIQEEMCLMSLAKFKTKLKNHIFDKTLAKIMCCL